MKIFVIILLLIIILVPIIGTFIEAKDFYEKERELDNKVNKFVFNFTENKYDTISFSYFTWDDVNPFFEAKNYIYTAKIKDIRKDKHTGEYWIKYSVLNKDGSEDESEVSKLKDFIETFSPTFTDYKLY